jgi:uncharacterized protein (TIGR00369 family)
MSERVNDDGATGDALRERGAPQPDEAAYFALLAATFHQAPITQHIRQVMRSLEAGRAVIELHADERLCHGAARVHGGVLALVLDNAGYFAAATVSGGYWVATTEFNVHLLEPVGAMDLLARGEVLRRGRHLIHTRMEIADGAGRVAATGLGSYTVLPRPYRSPRPAPHGARGAVERATDAE